MTENERESCDDCPFYSDKYEVCCSPIGCLNEGVPNESEDWYGNA